MNEGRHEGWGTVTWQGAEEERRIRDRHLSLRQKLVWNAQALALSKAFGEDRTTPGSTESNPRSTQAKRTHS